MAELNLKQLSLVLIIVVFSKETFSDECLLASRHPGYRLFPDYHSCGQRQIPYATKDEENPERAAAVGELPWMVYIEPYFELWDEESPVTESPSQSKNNLCDKDINIDLIFDSREPTGLIVFKGSDYWSATLDSKLQFSGPHKINNTWANLPSNIDAAFSNEFGVFFYKDPNVWFYRRKDGKYEFESEDYPKPLSKAFFIDSIDAFMGGNRSIPIHFFKDYYYYQYKNTANGLPQHNISSVWKGIPDHLDWAVNLDHKYIYFFKDNYYYKFDQSRGGVELSRLPYPRSVYQLLNCEPTPPALKPPSLCVEPSYDLILNTEYSGPLNQSMYIIRDGFYWKANKNKTEGPYLVEQKWSGFPLKADAGFYYNGKFFFFKGSMTYTYYFNGTKNETVFGYSQKISDQWPGIPDNIDAVLAQRIDLEETDSVYIYFYKGANCWVYLLNEYVSKAYEGYPKSYPFLENFNYGSVKKVEVKVDAAVYFDDKLTYIFKGRWFFRLEETYYYIASDDPPYPRSIAEGFFGCKGTAYDTLCNHPTYDLIFNTHGRDSPVFVFRGPHFWKVDKGIFLEGPAEISKRWPELPSDGVKAAYTDKNNVWFFKNDTMWCYRRLGLSMWFTTQYPKGQTVESWKLRDQYPRSISAELHIFQDFDAVLKYDEDFIYYFVGKNVYRRHSPIDESTSEFTFAKEFPGVPEGIDSVAWHEGKLYFFKNGSFYHFDIHAHKVTPNEAFVVEADWFGCEGTPPSGILDGALNTQYALDDSESLMAVNCSGVVISKDYILATASCFVLPNKRFVNENSIRIYLSQHDTHYAVDCSNRACLKYRDYVEVSKLIIHEEFDPRNVERKNNIAMLKVKKPLSFSNYLHPACLPTSCHVQSPYFSTTEPFTAVGWGIYKPKAALEPFQWLQKLGVQADFLRTCLIDGTRINLTITEYCVNLKDYYERCDFWKTGSPVFFIDKDLGLPKYMVYLLPQRATRNCHQLPDDENKYVIYTRVTEYLKWILDTAANDQPSTEYPDISVQQRPSFKKYQCDDPVVDALLPTTKCGKSSISLTPFYDLDKFSANFGEFPWTVLVHSRLIFAGNPEKARACNGVLISSRYVVTAAHCITLSPPLPQKETDRRIQVSLGEFDTQRDKDCAADPLYDPPKTVCADEINAVVDRYFIHGKFDPFTRHNDIALLRLKEEVQFSDYIKPICLPTSCVAQEIIRNNTGKYDIIRPHYYLFNNLSEVGWNIYNGGKAYINNMQRRAADRVQIQEHITNKELSCAEYEWLDNNTQYCVITPLQASNRTPSVIDVRAETCNPYTGGPLIAQIEDRYHLLGISSIGEDCQYEHASDKRDATAYTKITAYLNWILERIFYSTFGLDDIGDEFDEDDEDYSL